MRLLTENDYRVLSRVFDMKNDRGFSKATGTTIEELKGKLDLSESKIRDALKSLIEYDYVSFGIKKVRKNTYYVTALGLDDLKKINEKSVNIIKKDGVIHE